MSDLQLYLASSSPRRQEILDSVKLRYKVVVPDIDESQLADENPLDYVKRVALEKAQAAQKQVLQQGWHNLPILAADTIVVQDKIIFCKPKNEQHAYEMWQSLSDNEHIVYTAMAIVRNDEAFIDASRTSVQFKKLDEREMQRYWATGEPKDKAGGYAVQGLGSAWVKQVYGSYSGVVGLPLYELRNLLLKVEIDWL